MSSPVLAMTVRRPAPITSSMPRASFAPPVPPASTTTGPFTAVTLLPRSARGQPRDLDTGAYLVAHVDRDDQRRHLLDDPGHLERSAVNRAQAGDGVHQRGHL